MNMELTQWYEDVEQYLGLLRNDCSTRYINIPAIFIKPVVESLVSPLTLKIIKQQTTFPMLGKQHESFQY